MTADSYLSLFLILMSFTIICLLHGEKLFNNLLLILFQIILKFGVNFFSIFNSYAPICAPLAQKDTLSSKSGAARELSSHKPQKRLVRRLLNMHFFYFNK